MEVHASPSLPNSNCIDTYLLVPQPQIRNLPDISSLLKQRFPVQPCALTRVVVRIRPHIRKREQMTAAIYESVVKKLHIVVALTKNMQGITWSNGWRQRSKTNHYPVAFFGSL